MRKTIWSIWVIVITILLTLQLAYTLGIFEHFTSKTVEQQQEGETNEHRETIKRERAIKHRA
jgi:flagellar basal body-associated protein FliL